jgi:hypothetical protein
MKNHAAGLSRAGVTSNGKGLTMMLNIEEAAESNRTVYTTRKEGPGRFILSQSTLYPCAVCAKACGVNNGDSVTATAEKFLHRYADSKNWIEVPPSKFAAIDTEGGADDTRGGAGVCRGCHSFFKPAAPVVGEYEAQLRAAGIIA